MPKRLRVAPTDRWEQLEIHFTDPTQRTYELIRSVVLFGQSPRERVQETTTPERTLYRHLERFAAHSMPGLDPERPAAPPNTLPPGLRSRAILASGISRSQDLTAYLQQYGTDHMARFDTATYRFDAGVPKHRRTTNDDGPPTTDHRRRTNGERRVTRATGTRGRGVVVPVGAGGTESARRCGGSAYGSWRGGKYVAAASTGDVQCGGSMAVYRGVVKGNVVVLPDDVQLVNGLPVEVHVAQPGLEQPCVTNARQPSWSTL